jgi:hypothetical protein
VTAAADLARTGDDRTVVALAETSFTPALGLVMLVVIAVFNVNKPRGVIGLGHKRPTTQQVFDPPPVSRAHAVAELGWPR